MLARSRAIDSSPLTSDGPRGANRIAEGRAHAQKGPVTSGKPTATNGLPQTHAASPELQELATA